MDLVHVGIGDASDSFKKEVHIHFRNENYYIGLVTCPYTEIVLYGCFQKHTADKENKFYNTSSIYPYIIGELIDDIPISIKFT